MNNRKCQLLVWMNSHYCSPAKTVTQRLLCLILLFHKTERCTVRVNHTMAAKLSADYSENQSVCRCLQSCVQRFCFHVGSLSGSLICAALWKSTCTILDFLHFFFFFCILVTFGWSSGDGAGHLLVARAVVWSLAPAVSEWVWMCAHPSMPCCMKCFECSCYWIFSELNDGFKCNKEKKPSEATCPCVEKVFAP